METSTRRLSLIERIEEAEAQAAAEAQAHAALASSPPSIGAPHGPGAIVTAQTAPNPLDFWFGTLTNMWVGNTTGMLSIFSPSETKDDTAGFYVYSGGEEDKAPIGVREAPSLTSGKTGKWLDGVRGRGEWWLL